MDAVDRMRREFDEYESRYARHVAAAVAQGQVIDARDETALFGKSGMTRDELVAACDERVTIFEVTKRLKS